MNADGGDKRKLLDGAQSAAWSPDGTFLAVSRDSDLFLIRPATGTKRNLTPGAGTGTDPTWSPDGAAIAYTEYGIDSSWISIVAPATREVTYTHSGEDGLLPEWSPDGSHIAFIRKPSPTYQGDVFELMIMDPDGSDPRRLATATQLLTPSWSPDGSRIAYVGEGGALRTVTAEGEDDLIVAEPDDSISGFDWSPDGATIAFTDESDLFLVDTDGGNKTLLVTMNRTLVQYPEWSPDGSHLVFRGSLEHLYSIAVDGTDLRKLTTNTGLVHYEGIWAPGGETIAYFRQSRSDGAECSDDSDNDYDGKYDVEDPDCRNGSDNSESHVRRLRTVLTIHEGVAGEVHSAWHRCRSGRVVTLFKSREGKDPAVSSDKSNRRGQWHVRGPGLGGRFYSTI